MRNTQYRGLKKKTWASIIILLELALIASLIGFWHKQRVLQAEASGMFNQIYIPNQNFIDKPTNEQQEIINYIRVVFGKDADSAFKVLKCENRSLNPYSRGISPNGSIDSGIFQINSVHSIPERFLYDWRTNVDIAYQIFKNRGWDAWACVTVYNALEK